MGVGIGIEVAVGTGVLVGSGVDVGIGRAVGVGDGAGAVGAGKGGDNRQVSTGDHREEYRVGQAQVAAALSGHRQHSFLCGLPGWLESGRVRGRGPGCGRGGHEAGLSPPKLGGLDHRQKRWHEPWPRVA